MKNVADRLGYIWAALIETPIVNDVECALTGQQLQEFEKLLNRIPAITPAEKTIYEAFRFLNRETKNALVPFLSAHEFGGLILTCDATTIADALGVTERVTIKWNAATGEYHVGRVSTANDQRAQPHAQPRDHTNAQSHTQPRERAHADSSAPPRGRVQNPKYSAEGRRAMKEQKNTSGRGRSDNRGDFERSRDNRGTKSSETQPNTPTNAQMNPQTKTPVQGIASKKEAKKADRLAKKQTKVDAGTLGKKEIEQLQKKIADIKGVGVGATGVVPVTDPPIDAAVVVTPTPVAPVAIPSDITIADIAELIG